MSVGFDRVGIACAGETPMVERFDAWIAAGHQAEMTWIEAAADRRRDPRRVVEGARSIIVAARGYHHPRPEPPGEPGAAVGRVSCYAWGRDYHKVLGRMLRRLVAELTQQFPAESFYWCVDTGPVQERAWAAAAGIGWIGKNSLVLSRSHGSYLFLGAVVTTLALDPDTPAADHCGTCTLCLDACPTLAIVAPRVVDARRCISYHTIENRGAVPADQAGSFGDWVFGCDVCQEVCPWNSTVPTSAEPDFAPRPGNAWLDLDAAEALSEDDFARRFEGSPIRRAKRAGLARNAHIARRNRESARPPTG